MNEQLVAKLKPALAQLNKVWKAWEAALPKERVENQHGAREILDHVFKASLENRTVLNPVCDAELIRPIHLFDEEAIALAISVFLNHQGYPTEIRCVGEECKPAVLTDRGKLWINRIEWSEDLNDLYPGAMGSTPADLSEWKPTVIKNSLETWLWLGIWLDYLDVPWLIYTDGYEEPVFSLHGDDLQTTKTLLDAWATVKSNFPS